MPERSARRGAAGLVRRPATRTARDRSARFFRHGLVLATGDDAPSRQLEMRVVVPACVMQAVTPVLLGAGMIDSYELNRPLSAWVPTVADEGFRDEAVAADPDLPSLCNKAAEQAASRVLELFVELSGVLKSPGDVLPVLPMGTYVRFRIRCRADDLGLALERMAGIGSAGVPELRYAMAHVLAGVLEKWGG